MCICACVFTYVCMRCGMSVLSMCVCVLVPVCMHVFVSVSGVPIEYLRVDVFIYFNGL